MLYYDGLKVPRQQMLDLLLKLEAEIGDLSESKMPCRRFKLPLTFKSKRQDMAIQRYIETQRPYASYLPDTMDFVAKNNAFTEQQFRDVFLNSVLMVVAVGFFCALPIGLPIDPQEEDELSEDEPESSFHPRRAGVLGRIMHGNI